mmetsp:Transcript_95230/g.168604  ORF Transcript_95230/g.168604 Transcript_95230/m.168604 type:complete len:325 (-) Transcript_95230:21-995(-)
MTMQLRNDPREQMLRLVESNPHGLTLSEFEKYGWTDRNSLMQVGNNLLQEGRIELVQLGGGNLLFRLANPNQVQKFQHLDQHHMLIYQLIEKAGDKGAWSKNLKDQSNLQQHTVGRITKELMHRKLIKEVKSVAHRGRKVFMLIDLEPAREVSGGNWYHDGEFATGWVEELRERCQALLEQRPGQPVSLQDLHQFVLEQPGPSVPSEDDIQSIMRTLELDEYVYAVRDRNGQMMYAQRQRGTPFNVFSGRLPYFVVKPQTEPLGLAVPCLACSLHEECKPGGLICPEKCEYIAAWLSGAGRAADVNAAAGAGGAFEGDGGSYDW